jgi:translocation and assembly module TamB
MDVKVNPKITIHGTPDDTLVEGSLVIYDGKYYRNVSLNLINMVRTKSRKEEIPDKKYSEPYLRNMGLNLYLTYKTPFEVDNNIAYLQLKPDLKILGTLNSPRISGRAVVDVQNVSDDLASTDLLDLETNLIRYQGKEFIVKKGVVDFINPYRIEPVLDFECQYKSKIRDKWNVYLAITGTLENMKFSLTSDPEEQEPDILSLLVLGKTTQELINGNSDSTKSAAQILSGVISRNLGQNIKDTTGIDQFEVKYTNNSTQENTQSDVKVSFGKYLSERMTVKYGVENKEGKTIQKAESVYKFFEELSLSLSQDTENTYGAELIYRLEFR